MMFRFYLKRINASCIIILSIHLGCTIGVKTEEEKVTSAHKRGAGVITRVIYFNSISHKKCLHDLIEKYDDLNTNIFVKLKAEVVLEESNYKLNNIDYVYSKDLMKNNKIKKCEDTSVLKLNKEIEKKWHFLESMHKKYIDIQRKYGANNYNVEGTIYPKVSVTVKNNEGKILTSFSE